MTNLSQCWAVEKSAFENLIATAIQSRQSGIKLAAAVAPGRGRRQLGSTSGSVAVITVTGLLVRALDNEWDIPQTLHSDVATAVSSAAADPTVTAILLAVDSPGGTAFGLSDLTESIRQAAAQKPVHVHTSGLLASAAYMIASPAASISATPESMIGSIGTVMTIADYSQLFERIGVKVRAISSGSMKGAGTPGTEITPDQISYLQTLVDDVAALFKNAVQSGRRMTGDRLAAVTDGRVHVAAAAQRLGLIDHVASFNETLNRITGGSSRVAAGSISSSSQGSDPMAAQDIASERSRVSEILATFGDGDFARAQIASGASVAEAKAAAYDMKLQGGPAGTFTLPGVKGLGGHAAGGSTAYNGEGFSDLVRAEMDRGKSQPEACRIVAQRNPQAHMAYLLETNPNPSAQAAIRERFATVA